ncbi:S9 family peptidase [Vitiosangium sp. GDMCC 1.1324]|uniref:alpha/beta hydrolase family protein n=1 Tax=Vitiosangium sp. (strain GDMCC 1.1324) TaxID=2138576 RepID=UPI0011B71585|nr:hypothetical protein [Vitiosangium sp. GDMCC 1.1324]
MTTVLYVHGLESGPRGNKARTLEAAGFTVVSAQMPCNRAATLRAPAFLFMVLAALGLLGALTWAGGALGFVIGIVAVLVLRRFARPLLVRNMVRRCVDVQLSMLKQHAVDVVVGSSFGGAITLELLALGAWKGRTLLLCPAQRLVAQRSGSPETALPDDASHVVVVHGRQDETVPFEHSHALVRGSAAKLIEVDDQHRLSNTATAENFERWIALTA